MIKLRRFNRNALLLNGAAIVIGAASLAVVARSIFFSDAIEPCKERFSTLTRLSLERNGALLTPADLQGQLANSDWGLVEGSRIVKLKSGPARQALELDLASARSAGRAAGEGKPGLGFNWVPKAFGRPAAACLSYSVFLPEGFTFGRGGRLPGLAGTQAADSGEMQAAFSMRFAWAPAGDADVYPKLPDWTEGRSLGAKRDKFVLQPGRWTELEQEIVLNTPGKADGILRVWQDGRLVLQKANVTYRTTPAVRLSGVLAEAVAGEQAADARRGPQKIWITPFELRWQ